MARALTQTYLVTNRYFHRVHAFRTDHATIFAYSGDALQFQQEHRFLWRMSSQRVAISIFEGSLPSARAACACVIRASTVCKLHRSFLSSKQPIVETRAERGGERRVRACKLPPTFVVADRFSTCTNIGYYLGRKSK